MHTPLYLKLTPNLLAPLQTQYPKNLILRQKNIKPMRESFQNRNILRLGERGRKALHLDPTEQPDLWLVNLLPSGPTWYLHFSWQLGQNFWKYAFFFTNIRKNGNELSISTKREEFLCQLSHSRIAMLYSGRLRLLKRILQDHKYRLEFLLTRNHRAQLRTLNKRLEVVSVDELIRFKYKQICKRLQNNGLQTSNH